MTENFRDFFDDETRDQLYSIMTSLSEMLCNTVIENKYPEPLKTKEEVLEYCLESITDKVDDLIDMNDDVPEEVFEVVFSEFKEIIKEIINKDDTLSV